jgi:hypothetical protein
MSSQNVASQTLAQKSGDNAGADIKTTGTGVCVVNGTYVASLGAAATIDLSDAAVAIQASAIEGALPLAGRTLPDNTQLWMLITTTAVGGIAGTFVRAAGQHADSVATLKIPYYPPTELCIGLWDFDADEGNRPHIIGTTNLYDGDCNFHQLVGPNLLPHLDNWDRN